MDSPLLPKPSSKEVNSVLESGTLYTEAIDAARLQRQRQRRRRRAFHFLGLFTLLSVWLVSTHGSSSEASGWFSGFRGRKGGVPVPPHGDIEIPHDVVLGRCANWDQDSSRSSQVSSVVSNIYEHPGGSWDSAFADFSLTHESALYLISRGIFSFGGLHIVPAEEEENLKDGEVKASVEIRYRPGQEGYIDLAKVCEISKVGKESNGLGIFTPRWEQRGGDHRRHHHPFFVVTLRFPKGAPGDIHVPSFETNMPIFHHSIEKLPGVSFGNFALGTANAGITVDDVRAVNLTVSNANAPIKGTYRASSSLVLETANAPIDVVLELQNEDSKATATTAKLRTANAPVKAETFLSRSSSADPSLRGVETGGNYSIDASTVNARIRLGFEAAPIDSALRVNAHTSVGPAEVELHPTFQGSFGLSTSLGKVNVVDRKEAEDPEGKGRKRVVDIEKVVGGQTKGFIYWDEKSKDLGEVNVSSAIAGVTLII